jgi:hypothetical protein
LSLIRFLGEEGINDLGISTSILLPTGGDIYSRLSLDVLRGNTIGAIDPSTGDVSGGAGYSDTLAADYFYANSARLMIFFPVSENGDLEVGVSGLTGIHDPYAKLRFLYTGLDFKYKWKPDSYTSITVQGEALVNVRTIEDRFNEGRRGIRRNLTSSGLFVFTNIQYRKIYSLGARFDWSESPYSRNDRAAGFAVFMGFYPAEESSVVRFQYEHTNTSRPGASSMAVNMVSLQFMFSMGPHKAHPF